MSLDQDFVLLLRKEFGIEFAKPNLLVEALTHRSYPAETANADRDNERMEFLGDAVLGLIVSEMLMKQYPSAPEGVLTKYRAFLVNEQGLAKVASKINLGQYLLLGKGEDRTGGRNKGSILADAFEAVVAAIYLSNGMKAVKAFVQQSLAECFLNLENKSDGVDYKSKLQEWSQKQLQQVPEYTLVRQSGPDHKKEFKIRVEIKGNKKVRGIGVGASKKAAEQASAKVALEKLDALKQGDL